MEEIKINGFKKREIEGICIKINCDLVKYSFLSTGAHNESWVIECKDRKYLLKTGDNPDKLEGEFNFLKRLKKNLAPEAIFFDKGNKVGKKAFLIEEFLIGKNPSKKPSDKFVNAMANWYKRLHKVKSRRIESDERKRIHSLKHWASEGFEKYKKLDPLKDNTINERIGKFFSEVLEICKKNDVLFKSRKNFSLTQNDPSLDNIFIEGNKIRLIDWEFAGFGLYERDLLNFFDRFPLSRKQMSLFLKSYGLKEKGIVKKRLKILSLILLSNDLRYLIDRMNNIREGKIGRKQRSSRIISLNRKLKKILIEGEKSFKHGI